MNFLKCRSVYGSGSIFLCLLVFLMATCNLPTSAAWQMSKFWPRYSIQRHLLPSNKPSKSLLPSEKREQQDNRGKATSRWSTFKQKLRPRPSDFSSRQLDVTKALSYNPSDPLHAYPNNVDLLVHSLFQQAATFEINNAAAVRTALNSLRASFWVGMALGAVGLAVPLATSLPLAIGRRRVSDHPWKSIAEKDDEISSEDHPSPEYWNYVDHMAQSLIHAIQNGYVKYEV